MNNSTHVPVTKEFLINSVLLSEEEVLPVEVRRTLKYLRRDKVQKPVIFLGTGSSGLISGAKAVLKRVEKYIAGRDIDAEIVETGSIGFYSAEPILAIQLPGKTRILFKNVSADSVEYILDGMFNSIVPEEHVLGQISSVELEAWKGVPDIESLDFMSLQKKKLSVNWGRISPWSIEDYIATGGYRSYIRAIRNHTHDNVCEIVEKSGLRGRGGGGFLTGKKWKVAYSVSAGQRYLICNANESDPGGSANRVLIENDPHRLIEGILTASYGIGTSKAYIYIRNDYITAIERLEKAIAGAKEYGLLGHNVLGSGFNIDIVIRKGPGAFVCGEETAMINSIEGKRAMPLPKPPYPAVSGLFGKPTIVNNAETLSNIPTIFQSFFGWNKDKENEEKDVNTKLVVLSGSVKNQGVLELSLGTVISDIIYKAGGGISGNKPFKAVQIGGPSGGFLTTSKLDTLYDFETLASEGIYMGSGGVVVLDGNSCIIDTVKYFVDFINGESCGKCIPCREGSGRMLEIFENITRRPVDENGHTTLERFKGVMQLESLAKVMKETSLCGLGQKAPNSVVSSLLLFREEYEEHIFERKCSAGVCKELRLFYIDVERCTGCTICAAKCPESAIIGAKLHPFFIVEDKCTGCGICYDVCKFSAVLSK